MHPPRPDTDTPSHDDDSDRFASLERALTRIVRRAFLPTAGDETRREAGVHLERATYTTLVRIADLDGGRLSDVAVALGLDLSTTSRHVKRLIEAGYVAVAADPQDARARLATPTAAGRDALARVRDARRHRLAVILAAWEPEEVARLATGIERLIDDVEAAEEHGDAATPPPQRERVTD